MCVCVWTDIKFILDTKSTVLDGFHCLIYVIKKL